MPGVRSDRPYEECSHCGQRIAGHVGVHRRKSTNEQQRILPREDCVGRCEAFSHQEIDACRGEHECRRRKRKGQLRAQDPTPRLGVAEIVEPQEVRPQRHGNPNDRDQNKEAEPDRQPGQSEAPSSDRIEADCFSGHALEPVSTDRIGLQKRAGRRVGEAVGRPAPITAAYQIDDL